MSDLAEPIPRFPAMGARVMRLLPLPPLSVALTSYARRVARRHPDLFQRLGDHAHARFVLDPTDLPLCLYLEPNGGLPRVQAMRTHPQNVTRIAGPLAALLGLVHGAYDGDALFFSRDLVIEGDTAAALALRNAVDDAELDLSGELAAQSGPFSAQLKRMLGFAERRSGVCLSRPDEAEQW